MRSIVVGLLVAGTIQMVNPLPASAAVAELEGLDGAITAHMKEWKVPGLAMAVVQDRKPGRDRPLPGRDHRQRRRRERLRLV